MPRHSLARFVLALVLNGCAGLGGAEVDLDAAREFDAYPLYWTGERFEGRELAHVELRESGFSRLVYGTCTAPPRSALEGTRPCAS